MTDLSSEQKKKLLAVADIVEHGDLAVLKKIIEFGDEIENNTKKIDDSLTKAENDITTFKEQAIGEIKSEIENIKKEAGVQGEPGESGIDGMVGKDGINGRDGKDGADGSDGNDGINGENGKDGSPDTGEQIIDKINEDESEKLIKAEKVEGLEDRFKQVEKQISSIPRGGGFRVNNATKFYDLTSQTNGSLKVFTVPKSVAAIVLSSDFPTILMEKNGFTINATRTQITLTAQNAPSAGSQLLYQYSSMFNS